MKLILEKEEVDRIKILINNRINELRVVLNEATDNEDEIKGIIRDYKALLDKINGQVQI